MDIKATLRTHKRHTRPILAGFIAGLCLIWVQNAFASPDQGIGKEAKTCDRAIKAQERRLHIPGGLLSAISRAESGRWDQKNAAIFAWPWTVTTGGKGHFLPNRADAVAFVKSLQFNGVENIDVGCMQINLKYHPDAFISIESAFAPNANAAYAANFLAERFKVSRSWIKAAGDYHSTTPELNRAYRAKINKLWKKTLQPHPFRTVTKVSPRPSLIPMDYDRTKSFNVAFRARAMGGSIARPGQAIANRMNALKPGASRAHSKGTAAANAFTKKRRAQMMAWRQMNGFIPSLSAPQK